MNEPKVLTRMRLSCCWGDNLNEKELNEVVDYISYLQNNWNELNKFVEEKMSVYEHKEASNFYVVFEKMQELQGDDKN